MHWSPPGVRPGHQLSARARALPKAGECLSYLQEVCLGCVGGCVAGLCPHLSRFRHSPPPQHSNCMCKPHLDILKPFNICLATLQGICIGTAGTCATWKML